METVLFFLGLILIIAIIIASSILRIISMLLGSPASPLIVIIGLIWYAWRKYEKTWKRPLHVRHQAK